MSAPPPPQDIQLMNIIDKLAQFVSRNGKEFEKMTNTRQMNNAKFDFLRPGQEFYEYYQYKLMESRRSAMLSDPPPPLNNFQQTQPQQQNANKNPWSNGNNQQQQQQQQQQQSSNLVSQIDTINTQQQKLREQIIQSEKNLQAQHQVLLQQQKPQMEEALSKAQAEHIMRCAQENQINLNELDDILQPIIDSCTKDSIANGKASILQQATNSAKRQIISQYILKKALSPSAAFTQKLHLIYLINDLLHHCVKKNADDLKNSLESVVIPMFCDATINASEDQKGKLSKLLTLWSTKANFFDSCAIAKLQSPPSSLQEYHNTLLSQYASALAPLTQASKVNFEQYQQQHQAFVQHATSQLSVLENQRQLLEQQLKQQPPPSILTDLSQNSPQIIPNILNNVNMLQQQNQSNNYQGNFSIPEFNQPPPIQSQQQGNNQQFFNLPPPAFSIPDFTRPPPGFDNLNVALQNELPDFLQPPIIEEIDLTPTLPYFELPAGLMVPLIRLEDHKYNSIDPADILLPAPIPPSERLLNAIEAFYSQPSHERPRDNEGWEKLGLYEYFKMKNAVKKQREDELMRGERDHSKSPSPIPNVFKPAKKIRKRIYRSKSPEKKSRSRSPSPELPIAAIVAPSKLRPKRRSRSPSPAYRGFNRENKNERSRKRSISPPSFAPASSASSSSNKTVEFIDEGNKGHQLLKKLGWQSGGGLGADNQGITQPISAGEVRDRTELYKGIGMNNTNNDPYENFRKNRSNNFIIRMKTRDAEKN